MTASGPREQSLRARIRAFARRPGGAANRDIVEEFGISNENAGRDLAVLQKRGDLFSGRRAGSRQVWFGTQAEAEAFASGVGKSVPMLVNIGMRLQSSARHPGRAPIKLAGSSVTASGVVTIRKAGRLVGEAVIPRGVTIQVGPSPMFFSRVQVDPDSRPFGAGFSALGPGRYFDRAAENSSAGAPADSVEAQRGAAPRRHDALPPPGQQDAQRGERAEQQQGR